MCLSVFFFFFVGVVAPRRASYPARVQRVRRTKRNEGMRQNRGRTAADTNIPPRRAYRASHLVACESPFTRKEF